MCLSVTAMLDTDFSSTIVLNGLLPLYYLFSKPRVWLVCFCIGGSVTFFSAQICYQWWRRIFYIYATIFFFQFKQRSSLGRECRAPLSWDLLTFLSPPPWWGPFDLSPLWSCVTRLCSGPCETHHAIGYCADWSQNLSGGVIAPLAGARSVSHSSTRGVAPKTAAQWGFWHMIRIHHECESVSYGAREIWEASSIFSNLRCSVGFVICLFSTKLDCNKV